jgi:exoribonuclease R
MHITPIYSNTPPTATGAHGPLFLQSSYDSQQTPIEYEIGVHIADVSFFVPEGSPLDHEARQRGNTVYLIEKSFPMLPRIFSEKFCSLQANEDRLAISCIYRLLPNGQISRQFKPWFGRSIVRSCCKLDYGTAQRMIENVVPSRVNAGEGKATSALEANASMGRLVDNLPEELWEHARRPVDGGSWTHSAWDVSQDVYYQSFLSSQRRVTRLSHGALTLTRSRLHFEFSSPRVPDDHSSCHSPTAVSLESSQTQANNLIEEYMLLTNYLIAEKLIETVSHWSLLRRHDAPAPHRLHQITLDIRRLLDQLNPTPASGPSHVSESLFVMKPYQTLHELMSQVMTEIDQARFAVQLSSSVSGGEATVMAAERQLRSLEVLSCALSSLMLKPIPTAEYFIVGEEKSESWRHYALSIPYYTHFTSPIRRYTDITVHRLLLEGLRLEAAFLQHGQIKTPALKGEQESEDPGLSLSALSLTHSPHSSAGASSLSPYLTSGKLSDLTEVASHCNETKNNSKTIQRKCEEIYLLHFLSSHPLERTECVITSINEKYVTVLLREYLSDHRIFYEDLKDNHLISWNKGQQVIRLTRGGEEDGEDHRHGEGKGKKSQKTSHRHGHGQRHYDEDDDGEENIIQERGGGKGDRTHQQEANQIELKLGSRVLADVSAEVSPKLVLRVNFLSLI